MSIGLLEVDLQFPAAQSLKDKRHIERFDGAVMGDYRIHFL